MSKLIFKSSLLLLISFLSVAPAHAKTKKQKSPAVKKTAVTKDSAPADKNGQLGTSFAFDAASIRGKYQMSGQGIAAVENEKVMDDLLGLRTHFRDRDAQEASRE